MLLADANGSGTQLPPLEVTTPSPEASVTPESTQQPLPTVSTESGIIELPSTNVAGETGGFSWLLILIVIIAIIGVIATLYLRNRR